MAVSKVRHPGQSRWQRVTVLALFGGAARIPAPRRPLDIYGYVWEATFAVLNRSIMDLLMRQNPGLVIKLLTQIILILSDRLRQASDILTETLQP
jgi:hypothetical protein